MAILTDDLVLARLLNKSAAVVSFRDNLSDEISNLSTTLGKSIVPQQKMSLLMDGGTWELAQGYVSAEWEVQRL